ncbi:acetyl-coenzyme A synthetase [Escherichia coli]|uniref:Acetyl-coenzyme A synthetase n=1 Tax=Escherichia coli TaxID=562 RepID=A0A376L355_ECOLX|nr:acetyl-coenzyme A synthetase [Escherichia coli]
MFEGVPNWPTPARMAQVVDKHQVNILYTAPTAIRALMAEGDKAIEGTDRSSLRILGSVGEPINPEAWEWYWKKNRQREMSGGRYLVADRNWRFHDHAAAWRYRAESRFGNTSVLRRATGAGR